MKQHLALSSFFDLEFPDDQDERKLKEIWQYGAQKAQSSDPQEILWEVMNLTRTLGAPKLGEATVDKVNRFVRLKNQETETASKLREFNGIITTERTVERPVEKPNPTSDE